MKKNILENEEAVRWWLENSHKVYDPTIEYPVNEELPLTDSNKNVEVIFNDCCNIAKRFDRKLFQTEVYQDLYWWNQDKERDSLVKLELRPFEMHFINLRYIEGKSIQDICKEGQYSEKYLWYIFSNLNKRIRKVISDKTKGC